MTDTTDPELIEIQERHEKRNAKRLEAALKYLVDDVRGRDFLWWLFSESYMFKTTFTGNAHGNFLEGHRNLGLKVMGRVLEIKPEAFTEMQLRSMQQEKMDAEEIEAATKGQDDE